MRSFDSIAQLQAEAGREVAVSDWVLVDQARIDTFADATNDHQWIHVDVERCRRESPWGAPIAHGFLTLSLISNLFETSVQLTGARLVVNYGLNKVRFPAPVPVDSRVRARFVLAALAPFEGGVQMTWDVTMEREGGDKPVCVAEMITRRYG